MSIHLYVIFVCFTPYPACSRIGKGRIVLRHSALHFAPNSKSICVLRGGTQRTTPEKIYENQTFPRVGIELTCHVHINTNMSDCKGDGCGFDSH